MQQQNIQLVPFHDWNIITVVFVAALTIQNEINTKKEIKVYIDLDIWYHISLPEVCSAIITFICQHGLMPYDNRWLR